MASNRKRFVVKPVVGTTFPSFAQSMEDSLNGLTDAGYQPVVLETKRGVVIVGHLAPNIAVKVVHEDTDDDSAPEGVTRNVSELLENLAPQLQGQSMGVIKNRLPGLLRPYINEVLGNEGAVKLAAECEQCATAHEKHHKGAQTCLIPEMLRLVAEALRHTARVSLQ
jgi:hypothetical protein